MEYNASTAPQAPGPVESQEGSIFDPYIQSVPEDAREYVTGYLKDAEKNVNTALQERAELQQKFGAYKDVDLSAFSPEQLSQVLPWLQEVGSNPEAYQAFVQQEAEGLGLLQQPEPEAPEGGDDLEAYVQSRIDQALNPLQSQVAQQGEWLSQREEAEAHREMETHMESTLSRLEAENKLKLTDMQQRNVLSIAENYDEADFVEKGFADWLAERGEAQAGFVQGKLSQPAPPIRSGGQAAPSKPKTFADVKELALQMAEEAM